VPALKTVWMSVEGTRRSVYNEDHDSRSSRMFSAARVHSYKERKKKD
jgi:hypothetical protein